MYFISKQGADNIDYPLFFWKFEFGQSYFWSIFPFIVFCTRAYWFLDEEEVWWLGKSRKIRKKWLRINTSFKVNGMDVTETTLLLTGPRVATTTDNLTAPVAAPKAMSPSPPAKMTGAAALTASLILPSYVPTLLAGEHIHHISSGCSSSVIRIIPPQPSNAFIKTYGNNNQLYLASGRKLDSSSIVSFEALHQYGWRSLPHSSIWITYMYCERKRDRAFSYHIINAAMLKIAYN